MAMLPLFYHLVTMALFIVAAAAQTPPTKYTNYTVGDNAGWFFNSTTNTTAANYSSWAASLTFNLGDFLIFNTNSNQTVVQTYNITTFRTCSIDDSLDNDTFLYSGNTTAFGEPLTISVPLTIEGPNFFFSGTGDGIPCQHGMAFEIQVNRGLGLPPSLNQPPPPPYMEPPGPDSAQSPPITINGGSQAPENGGVRGDANMRVIACALLFIINFLFLLG